MRSIALPLVAAMAFAFTACSNDPPPPDVLPPGQAPMNDNDTATPPVDPATDPMNPPPTDPASPTPTDPTMPPPDPMTQPPTDPTTTPPATPPVEGEGTTPSGT